jgi:hypothetical protein
MSIEAMKQALEALGCIESPLQVWEINKLAGAMNALHQAIEQAEKQEPVDWDLSNSATVERARKVVKLITGRNQNAWSETDRETVHAINALINFAVMQFHRANTAPREWVGLATEEAKEFYESDLNRADLINKIDEFLEEKNT